MLRWPFFRSSRQPFQASPARAPLALSLEPRMMFDGAVAASIVDAAAGTDAQDASIAEAVAAETSRQEVVFIDSRLENHQQLVQAAHASGRVTVLIGAGENGLQQVADYLDGRSGIDAIHILGHGQDGQVRLGSAVLDSGNIAQYDVALQRIGGALDSKGDILLYGCEVATSHAGRDLIQQVATLTQADIAASTNDTGAAAMGGDWILEYQVGSIEADVSLDQDALATYDGLLALPSATQSFSDTYWNNNTGGNTADGFSLNESTGATRASSSNSIYFDTAVVKDAPGPEGNYYYELTWTADGVDLGKFDLDGMVIQSFGGNYRLDFTAISNGAPVSQSFTYNGAQGPLTVDLDAAQFNDISAFTVRVTNLSGAVSVANMDLQQVILADLKGPNDAPTVANPIPNQNATEDSVFSFQFAGNVFNDVNVGDTLTYSAQLAGGGALPGWLSFNPTTRTFSGTPLNADVGTLSVNVAANDGKGGTVTDTFDIAVANTNDAPAVGSAIPNQNATEDAAFNFQFAVNTFNDADVGDTLTYSSQLAGGGALPAWLSFDGLTRTFSGTPANGNDGTVSIEVTANDGNGATVTDTFDILVANTNDAPTVANPIPSQNATEDSAFNFQFAGNTFSDVDAGTTLTYNAQLAGGAALPGWLSFDPATRIFSGTPLNADVGTLSINVIASDGNGATVTDTFDIVVANTNDAPTLANPIPNQNATEHSAFNFQFAANTFSDVDAGTTLTYSAQLVGGGALPAWLSFDTSTRTFSGTPANGDDGTVSIEVTANDSNGGIMIDTFDVVVTAVNDAPVVTTSGGNSAFIEGQNAVSAPVVIDSGLTLSDVDNAALSAATVSISGSFQAGQDVLGFTNNGSGMGNISASYNAGNGVLTLTSAGASATVGEWQAALRSITYSNGSETPATPTRAISFVVNDGSSGSNVAIKNVTVASVNDAPVVSAPASISVTEDTASVVTGISFSDLDAGGGSVTATLSVASGALAATSSGGVAVGGSSSALTLTGTVANINAYIAASSVRYTTASNATSDASLTVSINDGGNTGSGGAQSDSDTTTLQVSAVNDAPVVTAPISINVTEDVTTAVTGISFADIDAGSSSVTATLLVASGTLSGTSGAGVTVGGSGTGTLTLTGSIVDINSFISANAVSFQTAANSTGNVILSVGIADNGNTGSGGNLSDLDTITLVVTAVNDAPVNAAPSAQAVDQDAALVFSSGNGNRISIGDADAGGGTVRVTLTASNGLITLSGTSGLSFIIGSGANDGTMTFEGSIADTNLALNGLIFSPTPGYNGAASLQITSNDLGLSGSGGVQTDTDTVAITVNSLNPEVTDVQVTNPDGGYKIGDAITVTVSFSETVIVDTGAGSPTLLLETGITDRVASYVSGSGSNTLTFSYTVQAGDLSADLDYQSTSALALNGASIRNAANDDAVLTLPALGGANSIAGQHDILVDGVAPTVGSVSVPANGTYVAGQNLDFIVNFNEAIAVDTGTGTPRLAITLDTGGTVYASYLSGSGSSGLVFRYTVQSGQLDANGISVAGALDLNGGTLRDAVGNDASTMLNSVGATGAVLVDAVVPVVASVNVPADAAYNVGDLLSFTVNASEAVIVDTAGGTPRLALDIGGVTRYATYMSGTGSSALVFQYSVQAGDTDANGIAVSGTLDLNGGATRDAAGNNLNLTLNSVGSTNGVLIDTSAPTPAGLVRVDSTPTSADSLRYTLTFSEAVSGLDTADFTLVGTGTANGVIQSVVPLDGQTYEVTVGSITGDGTLRLDLNAAGTGITDQAGNSVTVGVNGEVYTLDNTGPAIASVTVPGDAVYVAGQALDFTVNFDDNVTVDTSGGDPRLAIVLESGGTVYANYLAGSGSTALVFRYTVQDGQFDRNGLSVGAALDLNGATLRDAVGNNASTTLNGVDATAGVMVDGVRPTATISVADTALAAGETSGVTITFSEAVSGLTLADFSVTNGVLSGLGSVDGGITWTATLSPTANITDTSNIITLDNTGVADAAGNSGTGTTDSNNYAIDTLRPTASIVVADTALAVGETSTVTITFNEAVTGLDVGDFTVANGALSGFSTADGGTTWTATLTPTASIIDTSNIIILDNTGVADAAGNSGTGTTDSNNYAIDTLRPTASIVVADTALSVGETSAVTITFNEAVNGLDLSDFTVANGALSGLSTADGGVTWTANLTPTVNITDTTNLITLGNAGVADVAGNSGTGTTDSNNYAIDTLRPTASIIVADTALGVGETSTVTITFNEAVIGLDVGDFTVANGALGGLSTADGGTTWTATLTPTTGVEDTFNLLTLNHTGVADAAGNIGAGSTDSNNYVIDTLRPTASIVVADTALASGETSTVTIAFNEAVSGLTIGDFSVANGALSGLSTADGGVTWTATLTPTANITDNTNLIELSNVGVADAAGNVGTGTTDSNNYAIDTLRPTASIVVADTALATGETSTVTITFNEAVSGLGVGDFNVANGALSGLGTIDGGITWTATLTPITSIEDTTNLVTLNNTGVADAAGNTGNGTTDSNNYAVDTLRPTANIVVADSAIAVGGATTVTITFNEAVSGLGVGDFAVASGVLTGLSTPDGGITWTATLTPTANITDTSNTITLDNTGVADTAGNAGAGTTDSNNYAVDTLRPISSVVVADTALSVGEISTVTITFNEAVRGLGIDDFSVANGVLSSLSTADGGITWTATLTPTANITDTSNLISLDNSGVADSAGNAGAGTTDSNNYAIDTLRPISSVVVADTALSVGETSTVTITFNEAVSGLGIGDFSVANGVLSGLSTADGGITWTATLTPTASITDTSDIIILDNTGMADAAGNAGTGTSDSNNFSIDTLRPTASIVVADTALGTGETATVTITFNEAVNGLDVGDFTVANGALSGISTADGGLTWTATLTPTSDITDISNLISLDSTAVVDAAGNAGAGTTDSNNYSIDTLRPTVSDVSVPANGTYVAGQNLDFIINFSESVTVDSSSGTPRIAVTLDTGGTVFADYLSGSGSSALVFRLTVTDGQLDSNGISIGGNIALNGGILRDAAGNDADTTLNSVSSTDAVLVDAVVPVVASVNVPADAVYNAGDVLSFTVNASEAITVNTGGGTPRLALDIGGITRYATYVSGSGSSGLVFQYSVQPGDTDANGIALGAILDANGGTLRDAAGNALTLALNSAASTAGVNVDTTAPAAIGIVRVDSTPTAAGSVRFTVSFDEAVSGVDTNDFSLVGTGSASGVVQSVMQLDAQTYQVTVGSIAGDGSLRLDLDTAATGITDQAGNDLTEGLSGEAYVIDNSGPAVASVTLPPNAIYLAGGVLEFSVNFDDAVMLDTSNGTPRLAIALDTGGPAFAEYVAGSGSTTLTFQYTVQSGQVDLSGIAIEPSLQSNGATLRDSLGNEANLVLAGVPVTTGIQIRAPLDSGDPEFRVTPPPPPVVATTPTQPTSLTPPPALLPPLVAPSLFEVPGLGGGLPPLGNIFLQNHASAPSFLAQVFDSASGDGSGVGFLGFGGGDGGVFGTSTLSSMFGDLAQDGAMDMLGGEQDGIWETEEEGQGFLGAPTLGQQLDSLRNSERQQIDQIAKAFDGWAENTPAA